MNRNNLSGLYWIRMIHFFDHYKHPMTKSEIHAILKEIGGKEIECHHGGIGVEARCIK